MISNPTGTCRLFITASVPPLTRHAPLFHQYSPSAVETRPRNSSTPHCSAASGRKLDLPNNRNAGNATANAPR
ncbi:hypothetical protein D9M71_780020 [compost metagenome]